MVQLRAVRKRYATRPSLATVLGRQPRRALTALDDVTLDVQPGAVFGLLGANGAGKTTLVRILSTMVMPDAGTAVVGGFDVVHDPAAVRQIVANVPPDERSLNWRLDGRENLRLFAALHGLARKQAAARVEQVLGIVGMEDVGTKLVAAYSSGMRQRLLLARALLADSRVLLLDEPTRALDPVSAQEFRRFLRGTLVERQGCTILLATHNAEEAFGFCDVVAVLDRGRLLATGSATALAARYAEERYAVLTSVPDHPAWTALERRGILQRRESVATAESAWCTVRFSAPGDSAHSAAVLRALVEQGVEIASFERIGLSLAGLITSIIGAAAPRSADA